MALFIVISSITLPCIMLYLKNKVKGVTFILNVLALIASLIFGNIASSQFTM